ncbi:hypothetical protein MMC08_002957 [Hypocenomyce scalaris]|nr:hypothetical protein [Hypocenomyce scalaris]
MAHTSTQTVQSKGIYYGLPTFPADLKNLKAIVAGANGISGQHMIRAMSQEPERWSEIYALSRRPPLDKGSLGPRTQHVPVDFLTAPEEIAKILKENNVQADYVFFFAYLQPPPKPGQSLWSNAEELCEVNGRLLRHCLLALSLASIRPNRFVLQTGLKQYGGHLGPIHTPHQEDDPRVTIEPNFYYLQEDILFKWCRQNATQWNVIRPSFILGAVKDAAMNMVYPLCVYAAVQAHLTQPLVFPGDYVAWDKEQIQSTAMLNSYMSEWAALTPAAGDQAFNAGDDFPFYWSRFWPILAGWYGVPWLPPDANAEYKVMEMPHTPRGYGPKAKIHYTFTLCEWAHRPEVQKAWAEMMQLHGLAQSPFDDIERIFTFTELALIVSWPWQYSMDKARKLGWHGYVNSHEAIHEVAEDLADLAGGVEAWDGLLVAVGGDSEDLALPIGRDAAHAVVHGGQDGDGLFGDVDAGEDRSRLGDAREAIQDHVTRGKCDNCR